MSAPSSSSPSYYACSLRGHCEPSPTGDFSSLPDCTSNCQGSENIDLIYLILSYDWDKASYASPLDQQELVKREFGLLYDLPEATKVVKLLADGELMQLLQLSPSFHDYLEDQLNPFSLFLLEVVETAGTYDNRLTWPRFEEKAYEQIREVIRKGRTNVTGVVVEIAARLMGLVDFQGVEGRARVMRLVMRLVEGRLPWLREEMA